MSKKKNLKKLIAKDKKKEEPQENKRADPPVLIFYPEQTNPSFPTPHTCIKLPLHPTYEREVPVAPGGGPNCFCVLYNARVRELRRQLNDGLYSLGWNIWTERPSVITKHYQGFCPLGYEQCAVCPNLTQNEIYNKLKSLQQVPSTSH